MESVFKVQRANPTLPREAFDLSYHSNFSAPPGLLVPCSVLEVNPNEHFEIDVNSFLRTQPLNSAAFVRCTQNIDFFFVPYRLLYSKFGEFLTGTGYQASSAFPSSVANLGNICPTLRELVKGGVSDSDYVDLFGFMNAYSAIRFLDMLGYTKLIEMAKVKPSSNTDWNTKLNSTVENIPNIRVNPLRLCAYQKIYFDHFCNQNFEYLDASYFNLDKYYSSTIPGAEFKKYLTPRYVNYRKNFFTSLVPQFQGATWLNDSTTVPLWTGYYDADALGNTQFTGSGVYNSSIGYNKITNDKHDFVSNLSTFRNGGALSNINLAVPNIRAAFALDKLYRRTVAAKDGSYAEQILAHYGFKPDVDNYRSQYLGSFDAPISISEVVSTANTTPDGGSPVGDISGKGLSVNVQNQTIKFDPKEHGIIMGVFYAIPESDYSLATDIFNTAYYREDFYQPEFMDLGKQTYSSYLVNHRLDDSSQVPSILGFGARYLQYKTKLNEIHGSFSSNGITKGSMSQWVAPHELLGTTYRNRTLSNRSMKVAPNVLDPIMTVQYNGSFETDPFLISCQFNIKAIRPMSVDGIPSL